MKRIAVLGSTGSIGRNTLDVIAHHPDKLRLVGIAARSRIQIVAEQIRDLNPSFATVWDADKADELRRMVTGSTRILAGPEGLLEMALHPEVDIVVIATSGPDGLVPLVRAIQAGKRIALASKELLVMAGFLIMRLVKEHGTTLIPIDSEHAALLQCLQGIERRQISRMTITGSGGPLWDMPASAMACVSREVVLAHPRWQMGPKITVDSATLMNKGLELIEARWLFDVPLQSLRVVIHPQAVVHALVELVDGTALAQLSPCDMRLPIQYALSVPQRWDAPFPRMDVTRLGNLHFSEPDPVRFPCLKLAWDAADLGSSACIALNGANDVAVGAYLSDQISFADIPRVIEETLEDHPSISQPTLEDVLHIDAESRQKAERFIHQWSMR